MKMLVGLVGIALLLSPATFTAKAVAASRADAGRGAIYTPAPAARDRHDRIMLACQRFIMDSICSADCWRRYPNNFGEGSRCQKQCMHCAE
jgi:hypothetical protein